jgi:hypothetical protein
MLNGFPTVTFHLLPSHFARFFSRINPSATFTAQAASQHSSIRALIEDPNGAAAVLQPKTFLQGSYRQSTAVDTINDIDIVVLCRYLSSGGNSNRTAESTWSRDDIFNTIAAPLLNDWRYADKIRFGPNSMCIKVDLGIKVEILPVVFKHGVSDDSKEPFALYRPHLGGWVDGYARYHQRWLTNKNQRCDRNFIPMIKVIKHLRDRWGVKAVSFHLECLLYNLSDELFAGSPAEYIQAVLNEIAKYSAEAWHGVAVMTPCGERDIFTPAEWKIEAWAAFHAFASHWANKASGAGSMMQKEAIDSWQLLLGDDYFPAYT